MPLLNDIRKMQSEGKTEREIIDAFASQGISPREITEAMAQSKIKEAVEGAPAPMQAPAEEYAPSPSYETPAQQAQPMQAQAPAPAYQEAQPYPQEQAYPQEQYAAGPGYETAGYEQYPQAALSTDTLSEISEQVVEEKLSPLRKEIEKTIDMRTTIEAKLDSMGERIQRIEKILDRLQLSILQKVGDYMTNIEDIKKEIIETQKSFKAISKEKPVQTKPAPRQQAQSSSPVLSPAKQLLSQQAQ